MTHNRISPRKQSITRISALLGALAFFIASVSSGFAQTITVGPGSHQLTFKEVRYDFPNQGQSTWFYTVKSVGPPAISHLVFELPCPDLMILDAGMWDGKNTSNLTSGAGQPVPGNFPAAPTHNPPTNTSHSLKFDLGFGENQTRHYYFTVNDNYAAENIRVKPKAGPGFGIGHLPGPSASCEIIPAPEPKAVSPILECVIDNGDGTYTAHFGFLNPNDSTVTVPLGDDNRFVGGNPNTDPMTEFPPGRSGFWPDSAMEVVFDGSNLVWVLQGKTSTASAGSTPCSHHLFLKKTMDR